MPVRPKSACRHVSAAFVSGVVKDAFTLWLNQNVQAAEMLAEMAISSAQRRLRAAKKVVRKKADQRPCAAGQVCGLYRAGSQPYRAVPRGRGFGGRIGCKQARDREYQAIMPLMGKILNTGRSLLMKCWPRRKCMISR